MDDRHGLRLLIYGIVVTSLIQVSQASDPVCSYSLLGSASGVLSSYNYPFPYRNNLDCTYRIYVDHLEHSVNKTVCLDFSRFILEECNRHIYDYLQIHLPGQEGLRYCGRGFVHFENSSVGPMSNVWSPQFCWVVPSNHTYLQLSFHSDDSLQEMGFHATYRVFQGDVTRVTPLTSRCNSTICFPYCYHGSVLDDTGCPTCNCTYTGIAPCRYHVATCRNRQCVNESQVCDGKPDCLDRSDETYFSAKCANDTISGMNACDFANNHTCGITLDSKVVLTTAQHTRNCNNPARHEYGPCYDHTEGRSARKWSPFLATHFTESSRSAYFENRVYVYAGERYCLSFYYHLSGNDVGALYVHIMPYGASGEYDVRPVWNQEGNYSNRWLHGEVGFTAISDYTKVKFRADRGGHIQSRIAVDDISLHRGMCSDDAISCNFEGDACDWHIESHNISCTTCWRVKSRASNAIPPSDQSSFDKGGGYIQMGEPSNNVPYKQTDWFTSRPILTSPESPQRCVVFYYYKHGTGQGSLEINGIRANGKPGMLIRYFTANTDNAWKLVMLPLYSNSPFRLKIIARIQKGPVSISIDQISVINGHCNLISLGKCQPGEFRCYRNGQCIDAKYKCDGVNHCSDGSDEDWRGGCENGCREDYFQCDNGKCVHENVKCDTHDDCGDRSDEHNCVSHGSSVAMPVIIGLTIAITIVLLILCVRLMICVRMGECGPFMRRQRRMCRRCVRRCPCRGRDMESPYADSDSDQFDGPQPDPRWFVDPPDYDDCVNNPTYLPLPKRRAGNSSTKTLPPSYQSFRNKGFQEITVDEAAKIMKDWEAKKASEKVDIPSGAPEVPSEAHSQKRDGDIYVITDGRMTDSSTTDTGANTMPDVVPAAERQRDLHVEIHDVQNTSSEYEELPDVQDTSSAQADSLDRPKRNVEGHCETTDLDRYNLSGEGQSSCGVSSRSATSSSSSSSSSSAEEQAPSSEDTVGGRVGVQVYDNYGFEPDDISIIDKAHLPTESKPSISSDTHTEVFTDTGEPIAGEPNNSPGSQSVIVTGSVEGTAVADIVVLTADSDPDLTNSRKSRIASRRRQLSGSGPSVRGAEHPSSFTSRKLVIVDVVPDDNVVHCESSSPTYGDTATPSHTQQLRDGATSSESVTETSSSTSSKNSVAPRLPAGLVTRKSQQRGVERPTNPEEDSEV